MKKKVRYRNVYRLERNGRGAFADDLMGDAERILGDDYDWYLHKPPGPDSDRESGELKEFFNWSNQSRGLTRPYIFGFLTLAQYKRWCKGRKVRKALEKANGKLIKFRVPSHFVKKGGHQCAFHGKHAKKVGEYSPANW